MSYEKGKKIPDSSKSGPATMLFTLSKKDTLEEWIKYHGEHVAGNFAPITVAEITTGMELSQGDYFRKIFNENRPSPLLPIPLHQLSNEQQNEVDAIRAQANAVGVDQDTAEEHHSAANFIENSYFDKINDAINLANYMNEAIEASNISIADINKNNSRKYSCIAEKRMGAVSYLLSDLCMDVTIRGLITGDPKFVSSMDEAIKKKPFTRVHGIFELMRERFGDLGDDDDPEADIGTRVGDALQKLLQVSMKSTTGFNQYLVEWRRVAGAYTRLYTIQMKIELPKTQELYIAGRFVAGLHPSTECFADVKKDFAYKHKAADYREALEGTRNYYFRQEG